jgi:hypothetical protein
MRNGPTSTFVDPPDTASYDALTDLFLGETGACADEATRQSPADFRFGGVSVPSAPSVRPEAQSAPIGPAFAGMSASRTPAAAIEIEALVMGHLPVRANPWASQYARAAADRASEPVALLRMLGGEVWIDLFGVPPAQRERHAEGTFTEAVEHAAAHARLWIVQCDENDGPASLPLANASAVTLLCAGNEAAVLAAFQTLKSLAETMPRAAGLRVAVMGADDAASKSITSRLQQSADLFLKRKVEAAPSVSKMGPTGGAPVYRGGTVHSAVAILEQARAARAAALRAASNPERERAGHAAVPTASVPTATITPPPSPSAAPAPAAAPIIPPRTTLASRIAGLTPLPFNCPDDATVEFARDPAGTLHLLRSGDASPSRVGAQPPDALRSLTAAHAWAMKNAALISMVSPGLNTAEAVQHLFTADPKFSRPLLDSRLRVHLLASVEVEGKLGWCCVELN